MSAFSSSKRPRGKGDSDNESPFTKSRRVEDSDDEMFLESDADISDIEDELEEDASDNEYEEEDEHRFRHSVFQPNSKENYTNSWQSTFSNKSYNLPFNQKPQSTSFDNPEEAFMSILSPEIIAIVVKNTNLQLQKILYRLKKKGAAAQNHFKKTDEVEIRGLIGLWLHLGVFGRKHSSVKSIFSSEVYGSTDAHLCFSRDRYEALMRCLRFDDKEDRTKGDKLAHIREIFDIFNKNCKKVYKPGKYLTVDEILLGFQGRCSFRMFIPSKAAKFGIKIYMAVDPETKYMVCSEVYLGKESTKSEQNLGEKVVTRLTADYINAGRTIVTDNFFTSPKLGQSLYQKKTHLLGTIRKARQELPADFVAEKVETGKAKGVYRNFEQFMKFQPKPSKSVFLYSTEDYSSKTSSNAKPAIVQAYNETKFGVDQFDEMRSRYSYSPKTRRWPLRIFTFMCDTAAVNASILYGQEKERYDFLIELSRQLMKPQKDRHSQTNHHIVKNYKKLEEAREEIHRKIHGEQKVDQVWCKICKKHTRTYVECDSCNEKVCVEHVQTYHRCQPCQNPVTNSSPEKENSPPHTRSYVPQANKRCHSCNITCRNQCSNCQNYFCSKHISHNNDNLCIDCAKK